MKRTFVSLSLIVLYTIKNSYGMTDDISLSLQKENKVLHGLLGTLSDWRYGTPRKQANKILKTLSVEPYFPYQDILVNGELLWRGVGTDCPSRYQAIKDTITKECPNGFTVLDIGANNGYFSLRLAEELGATCVMADGTDRLTEICKLNTEFADKLIYLKKYLTTQDLKELAKTHHFDLIIGLHVLHHIPDWKEFSEELFKLGNAVILETPPANDPRLEKKSTIPAIEKELLAKQGIIISQTARTIPGYFEHLKKMKVDMDIAVPVDEKVKSKMFFFKGTTPQASKISVGTLSKFNMVYPSLD